MAVLLIAYGLLGLVILTLAGLAAGRPLEEVDRLTVALGEQRTALLATLRDTSTALGDAAATVRDFDGSLAQARVSAGRAADLTRDVSTTMAELSRAANVELFGSRPLAALADGFGRASEQLTALGADLDTMRGALERNGDDLRRTSGGLEAVRADIDRLAAAVEGPAGVDLGAAGVTGLRVGLFALGAWLAGLAVASLVAGVVLWRWGSRPA